MFGITHIRKIKQRYDGDKKVVEVLSNLVKSKELTLPQFNTFCISNFIDDPNKYAFDFFNPSCFETYQKWRQYTKNLSVGFEKDLKFIYNEILKEVSLTDKPRIMSMIPFARGKMFELLEIKKIHFLTTVMIDSFYTREKLYHMKLWEKYGFLIDKFKLLGIPMLEKEKISILISKGENL